MNIKNTFKRLALGASAAVLGLFSLATFSLPADAFTMSTSRDCDANAVMYCGAGSTEELIQKYNNGVAGRHSAGSVQDIFRHFNISSGDVQAMNTTAVAGRVTRGGEVYINSSNAPVATGAITSGRQNMAGSTQVTSGGTTFYTRPPSASFRSASLPAFVVMENGTFKYAVIASCGNPVKATPTQPPKPQTPNYQIDKTVAKHGSTEFVKNLTVDNGSRVTYRVTVKGTGDAAVNNVNVTDKLPANVSFAAGTLSRDGTALSGTDANKFFGSEGNAIASLAPGATVTYQFEATVGNSDKTAACNNEALINTARMTSPNLPPADSSATVNKNCTVNPICKRLSIKTENRTVTITALDFDLNGATFKEVYVDWGDTSKTATFTEAGRIVGQSHTYQGDGPYTITAHVTAAQNGKDLKLEGAGCVQQVSFTTPTPPPAAPEPPRELVKAGPSSALALFALVSVAGALGHRWLTARRLSEQP